MVAVEWANAVRSSSGFRPRGVGEEKRTKKTNININLLIKFLTNMKQFNNLIALARQKIVTLASLICSLLLLATNSSAADYTYYFDLTNAVSVNSDWSKDAYAYYFGFGTASNQEKFKFFTAIYPYVTRTIIYVSYNSVDDTIGCFKFPVVIVIPSIGTAS